MDQNSKRATSRPVRDGYFSVEVLIDPKPETICIPGWEQAPFPPVASLQTGAVCGLMLTPLTGGPLDGWGRSYTYTYS